MGFKIKMRIFLLLLVAAPALLYAEVPATGESADDLYQGALQAYLAGDFDQAILMDTKALQLNPQYPKAEGLLSILISEKDTAKKTVIWIGDNPPRWNRPLRRLRRPSPFLRNGLSAITFRGWIIKNSLNWKAGSRPWLSCLKGIPSTNTVS